MTENSHGVKRRTEGRPPSPWTWLTPTLQALAAVGALAYATIRVSFQDLYDPVGIPPEAVGASSTTILAESSLRVLEFGILFALVPVLLVLAGFLVLDRLSLRIWKGNSERATLARRVGIAIPAVGLFSLFQLLTHGRTYTYSVGFSLIGLCVLAIVCHEDDLSAAVLRRPPAAIVIVAWIGFTICWIVITSLALDGRNAGACLRQGVTMRYVETHRHYPWTHRLPVLRVQAEVVDPSAATDLGATRRARLLYLGESGGTRVIWDASDDRTLLVPAATKISLEPRDAGTAIARPAGCKAYLS